MVALPKVINISVAKLTHIAYLPTSSKEVDQLIQVNLNKDFKNANEVKTAVFFGRLGPEKDRVKVTTAFPEDALIIRLHFNFQVKKNDFTAIKTMKERINEIGRGLKWLRIPQWDSLKRKAEDETASEPLKSILALFALKIQEFPFEYTERPQARENWIG